MSFKQEELFDIVESPEDVFIETVEAKEELREIFYGQTDLFEQFSNDYYDNWGGDY